MAGQLRQRRERRRRRVLAGGGAVAVLALVGDDQHRRVGGVALHMLPGGAAAHRAALVVAAWVGRPLDGFLAVLAPRVLVGGDVRHFGADRRHADRALHTVLPALRAVAAPAVSTVLAAGDVLRVRVVVALALLRRTGGRRLRAAGRAGRRWEHEERRASRAPVRHAPVPGRHRRQERRARAGHAEPGVPAVTGHRLGEVQRQGPRGGSRRRLRGLGGGRSLRLRLRPRRHGATPEPRVPRAVQDGDHLLELGHRHVRELPAVNLLLDLLQLLLLLALRLYRRWGRRPLPGASLGELQDETLHPAQPRRGGLLDGHLLVHPPVPSHQIEGRHLRRRRQENKN